MESRIPVPSIHHVLTEVEGHCPPHAPWQGKTSCRTNCKDCLHWLQVRGTVSHCLTLLAIPGQVLLISVSVWPMIAVFRNGACSHILMYQTD